MPPMIMTDRKFHRETELELLQATVDSSSPLTILDHYSTVGMIAADAEHWQIEPFVPIEASEVRQMLDARRDHDHAAVGPMQWERFLPIIDRHLDQWSGMRARRMMTAYHRLDPDRRPPDGIHADVDAGVNADVDAEVPTHASGELCDEVEQLAIAAGYTPVSQDQIEQCVGIASHWGVPLNIDFDAFERLDVFARGDVVGYRVRRALRSLYRNQVVEVPVYRRMLVAFEMKADAKYVEPTTDNETTPEGKKKLDASTRCIHLRMFKNIPKTDVDMLLPTARVKISGFDRLRIVLPSLGGFLMSLRKIAQFTLLLAALALHWVAILAAITIGYLIKSALSYFRTKNRYQLNLTKNLYFQKVGSGDVVLTSLVHQAATQKRVETMLAYYGLMTADEPISTRRLKRRCQRYIREGLGIEIEFRVDRAVTLLVDTGLARRDGQGWSLTESIDKNDRSTNDRLSPNPP